MKIIKYNKKNKKVCFYVKDRVITISGNLGKLNYTLPTDYINIQNNKIFVPKNQFYYFENKLKSLFWSVNKGWSYQLDIKGKGFKLFKYKDYLSFDLGYSNLFLFKNKNNSLSIYSTKYKIIINSLTRRYY